MCALLLANAKLMDKDGRQHAEVKGQLMDIYELRDGRVVALPHAEIMKVEVRGEVQKMDVRGEVQKAEVARHDFLRRVEARAKAEAEAKAGAEAEA